MSTEKMLLNATESADFVGFHRSVWSKLKSAGELPQPVRLRKRDYWNRDTLKTWLKEREGNGHD
jgi:predicted DNA-binding transcriptional regulator AlpA